MTKRIKGSCTTILVGKKASIDGSTMIARNEDGAGPLNPQKFILVQPEDQPKHYKAVLSKVEIDLPDNPLRYSSTPDATDGHGIWAAAGINSKNVAMTATETITSNARILGVDPLVDDGIGEEDITTITLPYINSAREGVKRLGALLEKYGTYEMNAMAFSDKDEVWYFESIGGHHWAAIRIPDDAYVVAPNRLNIDDFDFASEDTLFAADLPELIETYHLNPDSDKVNLRHIFGSATVKDTRYNNPRAWYGQKYFNPEFDTDPIDQDLPFICRTDKKISVEDLKFVLSSHYQNTQYDPYGTGSEADKKKFRPIGINRNQELHILQIRNDVPAEIAGIHWLAFGPNTFNAVIPFYANINDTPEAYKNTTGDCDPANMYWLSNILALLGDSNFALYEDQENLFEENTVADCRNIQIKADKEVANQSDTAAYLTEVNAKMADVAKKYANTLLGQILALGEPQMKLQFTLND
ncbi:peptidase U34 [Secundilactobacillus paracollinoides]|uniref:Dipeptidase n=1 Tax=Secundilactobacillus paracollinoides TaxID=240427 RepID=A0A1B2J266_9LACO|nr:C69 family dipeptidase [Secundilactobacillus paracollinoides]ANZ60848.1 peptidase U34 [Secundilactobacillus paracollinoides]ANZ65235.1 peptidase U34 [Secundilactobacillus paracollinoides]ANZ68402.1 peptidase U34 [Secundilactobacillus paracollinoides]